MDDEEREVLGWTYDDLMARWDKGKPAKASRVKPEHLGGPKRTSPIDRLAIWWLRRRGGSVIMNCTFTEVGDYGIRLTTAANSYIAGNTFTR